MLIKEIFASMGKIVDEIASLLPTDNDKIKQQLHDKAVSIKRMSDNILDEWIKFDEQLTSKIGKHFPELFHEIDDISLDMSQTVLEPKAHPDQAFLEAKGYFDLGLYQKSYELLKEFILRSPDDELARLFYAYSAIYSGHKEEAVHQFTLLSQWSSMPKIQAVCMNAMGILYFDEQQYDRAVRCFSQALTYDEDLFVARYNMGMTHYCLGRYKESIEQWEKYLLFVQKQDVELLLYLCNSYLRLGQYGIAKDIIENKLSKCRGKILIQLGKFYEEAKQYEEAIACYRNLYHIDPKNSEALHGIGWNMWLKDPHNRESVSLLKKALTIDPTNCNILFSLAWIFFHDQQLDKAKYIVDSLLQQSKPMPLARSLAFLLALQEDKYGDAEVQLHYLRQENDSLIRALADLMQGKLKLKQNRFDEAIVSFKNAIWNNPNLRASALIQEFAHSLNFALEKLKQQEKT